MTLKKCFILISILISSISAKELSLDAKEWNKVEYSKIESNKVSSVGNALEIQVNNSSSALVLPFSSPTLIKKITVKAKIEGELNYNNIEPGNEDADDFPLRIGLILKGDNRLNYFQRKLSPDWLIKLDSMAKKKGGFDKIYSLVFYTTPPSFSSREHPLSEYFQEVVSGKFINSELKVTIPLTIDKEVIGIWMSADGDDTKSTYKIIIQEIRIN